MENTENRPFGSGKNYKLPDERFYWGHYLNLGEHYVHIILKEIAEKHGLMRKDAEIGEIYTKLGLSATFLGKPELERRVAEDLVAHFPFLRLSETMPTCTEAVNTLKMLTTVVNNYRNYCSHYIHNKPAAPDVVFRAALQKIFDAAIEQMETNHNRYPKYNPKDEADKIQVFYGALSQEVQDFRKTHTEHLRGDWYRLFGGEHLNITSKGLTFLTCLLLENADAMVFLRGIKGFKDGRTLETQATHDVFMRYCSRLPKPKLQSSDVKLDMLNELRRAPQALWQTYDEAGKAIFKTNYHTPTLDADGNEPSEAVYQRGNEDRFAYFALRYLDESEAFTNLRFQIQIGRFNSHFDVYEKQMHGVKHDRERTHLVRTFARINEFLDKSEDDYVNSSNQKLDKSFDDVKRALEDAEHTIFQLIKHKKDNTFYLDSLDFHAKIVRKTGQLRKDTVSEFEKQSGDINQYAPHYNIQNNTIRLRLSSEKSVSAQADAVLSIYELPNLVLYNHLYPKTQTDKPTPTEKLLQDYIDGLTQLYKDIKEQRVLPQSSIEAIDTLLQHKKYKGILKFSYLSDNLRNYLLGRARGEAGKAYYNAFLTKQKIKAYRSATKDKIFELAKKKAYFINNAVVPRPLQAAVLAKKELIKDAIFDAKQPKIGDIAKWLAKDIGHLKPYDNTKANKGRPTDEPFNKLQEAFATKVGVYSIAQWQVIFGKEELQMTGNKEGNNGLNHPFLYKCIAALQSDIYLFYEKYLIERYNWIDGIAKSQFARAAGEEDKFQKDNDTFYKANDYWLKVSSKYPTDLNYLDAEGNKTVPINLPRGLFNDGIIAALKAMKNTDNTPLYPVLKDADNAVYALKMYLYDDQQFFYDENQIPRYRFYKDENKVRQSECINQATFDWYKQELAPLAELKKQNDIDEKQIKRLNNKIKAAKKELESGFDREIDEDMRAAQREIRPLNAIFKPNQEKQWALEVFKNRFDAMLERQKAIRYTAHCDRVLYLMIKDLFAKEAQNKSELFKLSTIRDFLDTTESMSVLFKDKDKNKNQHITADLPMYRYGEFRKFLKDIRIAKGNENTGLLHWYDARKIDYERIKLELDYYSLHRHEVLEKIFEFEKAMNEQGKMAESDKKSTSQYIDHKTYLAKTTLTEAANNDLALLRNKLLHNQIPFLPNIGIAKITPETLATAPLITQQLIDYAIAQYHLLMQPAE
jgi:hypothetical protein